MQKFLLAVAVTASVLTVGSAAAVRAADMPVKAVAHKTVDPTFNWTGFYVGLNAGYGSTRSHIFEDCQDCVPNPIFPMGDFSGKGFIGGAQAGYNYQMSNILLGVEADMDYFRAGASGIGLNNGYIQDVHYNWFATARGRAGVVFNRTLLFATGGAAFANIFHSSLNPQGASGTTTRTGWTVGGGIEHAFGNNWSVKVEYLYADMGTTVLHGNFTPPRPIFFHYEDKLQMVRLGVNYLFNGR